MLREARVEQGDVDVNRQKALENLDRELGALSAIQREAVILRYLKGYSEKEAARIAGCPQGTLGRRASDGIARLRKRLAKQGFALGTTVFLGLLEAEARAAVPQTLLPSIVAASKVAAASAAGTPIANPADGNPYVVEFGIGRAAGLDRVQISGLSVGGDDQLGFGAFGQLDETKPASITLSIGSAKVEIALDAVTGEASVGQVQS